MRVIGVVAETTDEKRTSEENEQENDAEPHKALKQFDDRIEVDVSMLEVPAGERGKEVNGIQ